MSYRLLISRGDKMYYYYKIENRIDGKCYIGITTQPSQRKRRHFKMLTEKQHFNPKLQAAVNKYGIENFEFEILEAIPFDNAKDAYEYEALLIKNKNANVNGYNCNPGGEWTGPKGKFTYIDIMYIKSACYYNNGVTGVLAEYYGCAPSTINNIRINANYTPWCEEFLRCEESEKRNYYEDFCAISNFEILKHGRCKSARMLSKDQVFAILLNDEQKYTTFAKLRRAFGFSDDHRYVFTDIRKGKTYKEFFQEYSKLSQTEKEKMLCHYTAMYK